MHRHPSKEVKENGDKQMTPSEINKKDTGYDSRGDVKRWAATNSRAVPPRPVKNTPITTLHRATKSKANRENSARNLSRIVILLLQHIVSLEKNIQIYQSLSAHMNQVGWFHQGARAQSAACASRSAGRAWPRAVAVALEPYAVQGTWHSVIVLEGRLASPGS